MPFALALAASALIHVAALLGPGWTLPGTNEPEPPTTIDAVLAKPAPRPEALPTPKPVPKPAVDRPRPQPVLAAAVPDSVPLAAPVPPAASAAPPAPAAVPAPPVVEPAAPVPVRIGLPGKGRVRYVITRGEGGFVVGQSVHSW
jgi:protein TonB